ncbi:hypothetical protein [Saccharothrix texasensis]|uniref:Uncharacterized protein n=1 Tax=Saccharothrix texasensis TaxID=103734 RepID=A0A3N1GY78_9PSEU|nr:hypothetical protein [Saccharothrix texasensis]ROP34972.1 hypothetical protein EDD40_0185 [Saccharothrix texasensis]
MVAHYRDEKAARALPALVPMHSQHVDEGYRIVAPDATLTAVVAHVQWLDNHPGGPDTHVMISFEDGANVEFPFDVPLTAVWHDERRAIPSADLAAAAPATWRTPAGRWK